MLGGGGGALMVSEYPWLAVADVLSVAVTVTLNGLPVFVVGVPEMVPVVESIESAPGRPTADHV